MNDRTSSPPLPRRRHLLLALLALLARPGAAAAPLPFDGLVRDRGDGSAVAFMRPPFAANHAATIEQLEDGALLLSWFSGAAEEAPGCAIVVARLAAGADQWSAPVVVSQRANFSNQNPVLFFDAQSGDVLLWHSQLRANSGEGLDVLWQLRSHDGGVSWGAPEVFLDLTPGGQGVFDRNRVVPRADGGLVFPGYFTTKGVPNSPFLLFAPPGNHSDWSAPAPIGDAAGLVQPSIVRTAPGVLTAFFRDRAGRSVFGATSRDEGASWSAPTPAQAGGLPNNNAGIEAFQLASGKTILLFNDRSGNGVRTPLTAALSDSGGASWQVRRNLQLVGDDGAPAVEFSYPTVLQTPDGLIHAAYTYNRNTIKYVRFNETYINESAWSPPPSAATTASAAAGGSTAPDGGAAAPTGLLADFKRSPALGVRAAPAFTWIVPACPATSMPAPAGDGAQTAYRIVLTEASSGATTWESGKVESSESTYVAYGGPSLAPATRYTWFVSTWTAACASPASAPAVLVTAPWSGFAAAAQFITTPNSAATFGYFRKEITLPAGVGVTSAIAFVAAYVDVHLLSGYKLYVDDQLVNVGPGRGEAPVFGGDSLFRGLPVTTLDVTALFATAGAHALALQAMHCPPRVILQLVITLADGSSRSVVTDSSWRAFDGDAHRRPGPAMDGGSAGTAFVEYIDARGEPVGWRAAGFAEGAGWEAAVGAAPSAAELVDLYPRMEAAMVVDEALQVASLREIPSPPVPPGAACAVVPNHSVFVGACPNGSAISGVLFASFGDPSGTCPGALAKGSCDSNVSVAVVEAACVGQTYCEVLASKYAFGGADPCPQFNKSLAVQLACPAHPGPPPPPPVRTSYLATFLREFQGGLRLDVTDGVGGSVVEIACGEHVTNGSVVDFTDQLLM